MDVGKREIRQRPSITSQVSFSHSPRPTRPTSHAPPMLHPAPDYESLVASFRWRLPARYNIGVDVCDRWAERGPGPPRDPERPRRRRDATTSPSAGCATASNRLANALRAHGVRRGDRVAILLPQAPEVAVAHIAIYKLGAVALPLAILFGVGRAGLPAARTRASRRSSPTRTALAKLDEIRGGLPDLKLRALDRRRRRAARSASTRRSRGASPISRRPTRRRTIRR